MPRKNFPVVSFRNALLQSSPRRSVKITVLACLNTFGGSEKLISRICGGLIHRGQDVTVLYSGRDDVAAQYFADIPKRRVACDPGRKFLGAVGAVQLARHIASNRPDVLYSHHRWPTVLAWPSSRALRIPLVTHVHSLVRPRHGSRWGHRTIAVSQAVASHIAANGADPARIRVIHSGVPLPEATSASTRHTSRQVSMMFGEDSDIPFGVYLGRLEAGKGLETLLDAVESAEEVRLVFLGDGPLRTWLHHEIARRDLRSRTGLFGWIADPSPFLLAARFTVCASTEPEGLPMAVIEAAAHGTPVIATPVGGLGELIEDRKTGFLVPPGDSESLAQRMQLLHSDRKLAELLGAQARSRIERSHSETTMMRQIHDTLRAATASAPRRG